MHSCVHTLHGSRDHNTVQVQGNACTCECVSVLCVHVSVACVCYECMHVSVNACVCVYRKTGPSVLAVGGGRAGPAPPPSSHVPSLGILTLAIRWPGCLPAPSWSGPGLQGSRPPTPGSGEGARLPSSSGAGPWLAGAQPQEVCLAPLVSARAGELLAARRFLTPSAWLLSSLIAARYRPDHTCRQQHPAAAVTRREGETR